MLLSYVKQRVQEHTGKPARRVVITVPAFFAEGDRRALLAAAKMAGLEVLLLVNDGLAVALKYGTDNLQLATFKGVRRVLFFDMGATATQATVVEFRGREKGSPSAPPTPPSIRVLGAAWDSSLGGAAFNNRLVDMLAKGCAPNASPTADARAMARLRKEAARAKHVLSANKETIVTIVDLVGGYDLKQNVTRADYEAHCSDLLQRVQAPVFAALQRAGNLTLKQLDAFELVGGGWRVPSIQQQLDETVGGTLGKTLNSDEAACGGAAIMALHLSRNAAVRKKIQEHVAAPPPASVLIQDVVPHDVLVVIQGHLAIQDDVVAVIPSGSPLIVLGGGGTARCLSGDAGVGGLGVEENDGFGVMIPVATKRDFIVNLQYMREVGGRPFASYRVTGVESALSTRSATSSGIGSGGSSSGGSTPPAYNGGGDNTVELHVR